MLTKETISQTERNTVLSGVALFNCQIVQSEADNNPPRYNVNEFGTYAIEGNKVFDEVTGFIQGFDVTGQGHSLLKDVYLDFIKSNPQRAVDVMEQYSKIALLISALHQYDRAVDTTADMFYTYSEVQNVIDINKL